MERKEDNDSKSLANESKEAVNYIMEEARVLAKKSEDPVRKVSALIIITF